MTYHYFDSYTAFRNDYINENFSILDTLIGGGTSLTTFTEGTVVSTSDLNTNWTNINSGITATATVTNLTASVIIPESTVDGNFLELTEGIWTDYWNAAATQRAFLTVSTTDVDSTYDFGQRYVKGDNNFSSYGSSIAVGFSGYGHNHTPYTGTFTRSAGTGYWSDFVSPSTSTQIPKFIMLGNKKILAHETGYSIPVGGILFAPTNTDQVFTSISGYYFNVGASADGGASTHTHTLNTAIYYDGSASFGNGVAGITTESNEIDDRVEFYAVYNSGTYTQANDIIPIGYELLQLISEDIPSNYSEVTLSDNGLLRFTTSSGDLLTVGGTEADHTHTQSSRNCGSSTPSVSYTIDTVDNSNSMPPYKACRIIKRNS